ncbi:MAG: YihY/virulence factor BrkB family protein [Anaerolineales bacterium]|nr:YihY/virulence factor BrkB family protein [Anaerolineales bacterium]
MNQRNKFGTKYIEQIEIFFSKANKKSFGFLGILRYAVERFSALRGVEGSASIAFFTIFGLPPLLIVLVSVASYYLEIPDIQEQIIQAVREILPIPPDLIIEFLEGVLNQRGAVGIIGLIGLAWAGSGVLMSLTANINRAWPTAKIRNVVENRLIAFLMIGMFILFIAVSSILSTVAAFFSQFDIPVVDFSAPVGVITDIIFFALRFTLFLALYFFVPKTKVKKRAAFWAAVFASVAWEVTAYGFNWYFQSGLANYNFLYGSLGTLVALMFWIYLNCLILVFGAYFSAAIVNSNHTTIESKNSTNG